MKINLVIGGIACGAVGLMLTIIEIKSYRLATQIIYDLRRDNPLFGDSNALSIPIWENNLHWAKILLTAGVVLLLIGIAVTAFGLLPSRKSQSQKSSQ